MKILQISNYYNPVIGGIEQVAQDCAQSFNGLYEHKIICFNHEKGDRVDNVDGVEVIRAGCFAKVSSQSLSFSFGKLLKKTFKSFRPDVVIFHYPNPFEAHSLLKVLKKYPDCKLVLYWHLDIVKQKILGKFFNGQNKRLCRRAVKIVATSPNYIESSKYLSRNRAKCEVVPCCVNTDRMVLTEDIISAAENIREQNAGKTICVAVGRHVPYKGTEYLVRASELLDSNFSIFIIGDGPLSASLKKLAAGDTKITFLGKTDTVTLKAYLAASDIFCFPSVTKNEAFGIALVEAMYYEKPSVTFTIGGSGVNYVSLNNVTGIEVENGNAEKFAEALTRLSQDEALRDRLGSAAKERVLQNFTKNIFTQKIIKLIEDLK